MLGPYHIIHAYEQPIRRRVRCFETGRYHRHQTHIEEFFRAACGETFSRRESDCCNITIADPNWDKNWCQKCVKMFPWTEKARQIWLDKHGIETLDSESWKRQFATPGSTPLNS